VEHWQLESRRVAVSWFAAISVTIVLLLTSKYEYLSVHPGAGIFMVAWGGIFGLAPAFLMDLRHFELMRKSLQRDIYDLESSQAWMSVLQLPVKGGGARWVESSIARFYATCFGILLLTAAGSAHWAWVIQYPITSWLSPLIHGTLLLLLPAWIALLSKLNSSTITDFGRSHSNFSKAPSQQLFLSGWKQYDIALNYFDMLLMHLIRIRRHSASTFLFTFTAISIILSTSDQLFAIDRFTAIAVISGIGATAILLLWSVDVFGYQKHATKLIEGLVALEGKHPFLPRFGTHLLNIFQHQSVPVAATMYCGHVEILIATATVSEILSPALDLHYAWKLALGALIGAFLIFTMLFYANAQTIFNRAKNRA
jgi:hypothetical protein